MVKESRSKSEIIASYLGGDGAYKDLLYLPGGGTLHPTTKETIDKICRAVLVNPLIQDYHYRKIGGE